MNRTTQSAECIHGFHGSCCYEDCACKCHSDDEGAIWDDASGFYYDEGDDGQ